MPRPKKISSLESILQSIVARAANEIAASMHSSISTEVQRLVGNGSAATPAAAPKKAAKAVAMAPSAKAAKSAKTAKPAKRGRRGIDPSVLDKVLAYVKANPGKRTEEITRGLGFDAKPSLAKLRLTKSVKTKGQKRATRYTA